MTTPFNRWRPHPWHGIDVGPSPPSIVHAFIEITPFDLIKYEVDKVTGYLVVDRPHRTSSLPPTLYGFVPQTYCGKRVGKLMPESKGGDGDPLDICVISERPIAREAVLLRARVLGGLPMLDDGEADDKIIAVLHNDSVWSEVRDVSEMPEQFVQRLIHYFSTYKQMPGEPNPASVGKPYGPDHAHAVIEAAVADYHEEYSLLG
ncbi:MAG: inorganic pyrophosphatase [Pseudomonadota bacterium]